MDVISHIDFLSLLAGAILIVCGAHVSLLAWLGKRMYTKIDSIEQMVTQNITVFSDRFGHLEGRVIRVETRLELASARETNRRSTARHEEEAA